MKYVMLEGSRPGSPSRKVPIIFPDFMVHKDVAEHAIHILRREHSAAFSKVEAVSAGFVALTRADGGFGVRCSGMSESLDLDSKPEEDSAIINTYEYMHGL